MARMLSVDITEDDLNAFVDGALDAVESAHIAATVYADRETATTVAAYRAQNDGLRALYDGVLDEPLPRSLQAMLDAFDRTASPAVPDDAGPVGLHAGSPI